MNSSKKQTRLNFDSTMYTSINRLGTYKLYTQITLHLNV